MNENSISNLNFPNTIFDMNDVGVPSSTTDDPDDPFYFKFVLS